MWCKATMLLKTAQGCRVRQLEIHVRAAVVAS